MSDVSILPPNHTPAEAALESAIRLGDPDLTPVSGLMDPQSCPDDLLSWLAWAQSVDNWDPDWPEGTKRDAIAASIPVHRIKGTPASIKAALAGFGYGEVTIVEGFNAARYDGSLTYDGSTTYAEPDHWAEYRVYLSRPITIDQAAQVTEILKTIAPERCHLKGLYFTQAANRYDGTITYDGTFTHGVAS